MPETMATFPSEDIPPDIQNHQNRSERKRFTPSASPNLNRSPKLDCDDDLVVKVNGKSSVKCSTDDANSFSSYTLPSSVDIDNDDSFRTSLNDDATFGSYSTNLTDEAFGSYEANLASFNFNINEEIDVDGKSKFRRDNLDLKNLKFCKSNQTSFSDLSSLTIYYIESDEEMIDKDNVGIKNDNCNGVELKDASTETTTSTNLNLNLNYRLRKCISDPVYKNCKIAKKDKDKEKEKGVKDLIKYESKEFKLRNSFHKDLNEALSSLLWQPYEYQNVESSDEEGEENQDENEEEDEEIEDSSIDCSDLEDTNNGEEAVNNLHRQQRQQRQKHQQQQQQQQRTTEEDEEEGDSRRRSRDTLPLSRSRLSAAANNSFSASCANEGTALSRVRRYANNCDGIFSEMTENLSATTEKVIQQNTIQQHQQNAIQTTGVVQQNSVQNGDVQNATIALRNLSQVNIVGLPNNHHQQQQLRLQQNSTSLISSSSNANANTNSNSNSFRGTNALTTAQFKYNANVNSANIVNLNNHHHHQQQQQQNLNHHHNHQHHHHQRHHSQIESNNQQTVPISHIRSLSVPKKLENNVVGDEQQQLQQRRFPINVSNVNVNYYRAVPANVVASVPQIQCVTSNDCVSNVNIVQAMPVGSNFQNQNLQQQCYQNHQNQQNLQNHQNLQNLQSIQNLQQCAVTTFGSSIITQHFPSGNTYNITSSAPVQVQTSQTQNVFSANTTEVTIHSPPMQFPTNQINANQVNTNQINTNQVNTNQVNTNQVNANQNQLNLNQNQHIQSQFGTNPTQLNLNQFNQSHNNNINATTQVTQVNSANLNNSIQTIATQSNNQSSTVQNNHQIQIVNRPAEVTRTFTSTEAQTDDTLGLHPVVQTLTTTTTSTGTATLNTTNQINTREQRRRERRERRHHRRINNNLNNNLNNNGNNSNGNNNNGNNGDGSLLMSQTNQQQQHQIHHQNDRLPDLLNSHMPPSYNNSIATHQNVLGGGPPPPMVNGAGLMSAPLVQTMVPSPIVGSPLVTFPGPVVAGQVPLVQPGPMPVQVAAPSGFRFPFQGTGFRRSRYSEDSPKSCCGLLSMKPGSLRWFIALIAFVAVCCVLVGTVLGAMRTSGRDHLTVSLLMIGVGIVLITVSGIAWKLTSHDSSTCRSMLGLGSTESVDACARRFVPRLPPSYGRPHHPYAAMMYPEFQYRPPPPSYQASMQEYRLRLLLLDRGHTPQIQAGIQNAVSPPPTYRSHAGSLLRLISRAPLSSRRDAQSEYSCPPSYRSQTSSSTRPNGANNNNTLPPPSVLHSRAQSLSLSESNHESVNVVLHNAEEDIGLDNITLDSLKMEPETELNPLKMLLKGSSTNDLDGNKDGNLVTIVQTSDQSPVIVTVSGSSNTEELNLQAADIQSEMQILAHL